MTLSFGAVEEAVASSNASLPFVIASVVLSSCQNGADRPEAAAVDCSTISSSNIDDCVRLNQIQVLGTHNSYHLAPAPAVLATLGARGKDLEYGHKTFDQAELSGARDRPVRTGRVCRPRRRAVRPAGSVSHD